jgi:hypothetical protein
MIRSRLLKGQWGVFVYFEREATVYPFVNVLWVKARDDVSKSGIGAWPWHKTWISHS